jgi:hypothetical protein
VISNRNANNSNCIIGAKDTLKDALTIFFIFTIFINIVNNFGEMECHGFIGFIVFEYFTGKRESKKGQK